jgi:hypothetical protein
MLRARSGAVQDRGTEKVRDARTMHYRVKVDPAQAVANAPEELHSAVRPLGSETIPAAVWLDPRGRLRRMRLRVGSGSLASPKGSVGFEYYDLGAKASVAEPPASEVIDFGAILGGSTQTPNT